MNLFPPDTTEAATVAPDPEAERQQAGADARALSNLMAKQGAKPAEFQPSLCPDVADDNGVLVLF